MVDRVEFHRKYICEATANTGNSLQGHTSAAQLSVRAPNAVRASKAGLKLHVSRAENGGDMDGLGFDKGGGKIAEHIDAVYGIFGEALLPWLPLCELANVLL